MERFRAKRTTQEMGWDCPAVDLDFLFLEYDHGNPIAIVEYKNEHARPQRASHPTYQAMIKLGTRAGVPVIAARYASDFSWWKIVALNRLAQKWIPKRVQVTQKEWVELLYKLRGYEMPKKLFAYSEIEV